MVISLCTFSDDIAFTTKCEHTASSLASLYFLLMHLLNLLRIFLASVIYFLLFDCRLFMYVCMHICMYLCSYIKKRLMNATFDETVYTNGIWRRIIIVSFVVACIYARGCLCMWNEATHELPTSNNVPTSSLINIVANTGFRCILLQATNIFACVAGCMETSIREVVPRMLHFSNFWNSLQFTFEVIGLSVGLLQKSY